MTFHDEFDTLSVSDDGAINHTRWTDLLWYHGTAGGKECYEHAEGPRSPFIAKDGILSIVARKNAQPPCKFSWTSGMLVSVNAQSQGFAQTYGYFEMRAKVPRGRGLWPAFWLLNVAHSTGKDLQSEIDIMEGQGSTPTLLYTSIHTHDRQYQTIYPMIEMDIFGPNWQNKENKHDVGDMSTASHTYSVFWDKARLTFYYDRKPVITMPTPTDFHQPMFILVNLDLGGWSGQPDETTPDPAAYQIDYVRVFSTAPDAIAVTRNPEKSQDFAP
jgi:beta-glucanase (GH16 family)